MKNTITILKDITVSKYNITNSKGNKARSNKTLEKGLYGIVSNHYSKGLLYLGEEIVTIEKDGYYFKLSLSDINNMNMRVIAEEYCTKNNKELLTIDFDRKCFFTLDKKEIFIKDIAI